MITRIFASLSRRPQRRASLAYTALVVLAIEGDFLSYARAEERPSDGSSVSAALEVGVRAEDEARDLDRWLRELVSVDASLRAAALEALERSPGPGIAVISARLAVLARDADRAAMGPIFADLAKGMRVGRDVELEKPPDGGYGAADWLTKLMANPLPEQRGWSDAVMVIGLSRRLARMGTSPAVRELASLYTSYGEMLRVDVERELLLLGERALPTLIELRRGESKELRLWALKILEALGKAIPGEAVQTADDRRLAEILVAYGRAKDADAIQVLFSFANSDRAVIRAAAREAIVLLGDRGVSPLRDSFENLLGKKAPSEWDTSTLQRELFAALDRTRLADVYELMAKGKAAYEQKQLDAAASTFDRVLAREPEFALRKEMAAAYLDFARSIKKTDAARAASALRQVRRVAPDGPLARVSEAELLVLEARLLRQNGVIDEAALRQAAALDPNNEDVQRELRLIDAESADLSRSLWKGIMTAAGLVLALGTVAGIIAKRRRSPA